MNNIEDVKSWKDLMIFITKDFYKLPKKKVAQETIGIAEKSLFDMMRGKIPKERLIRQISGFVNDNYNAELTVGSGVNIKIKQFRKKEDNNNTTQNSQTRNSEPASWEKQREYLLNRVMELEDEVKRLRGN